MYLDFILYLSKFVDLSLLSYLSFAIVLYFMIVFIAIKSADNHVKTLKIAIDKWYSNKELTRKEEKIFIEYAEMEEKMGY